MIDNIPSSTIDEIEQENYCSPMISLGINSSKLMSDKGYIKKGPKIEFSGTCNHLVNSMCEIEEAEELSDTQKILINLDKADAPK